ncbi:MAG: DNA topoisomerase IV [Flavobacteriaceae bacterium]|nr:DNA topoisomerase IV [Flavobacteriaceae bacterium]
MQFITGLLLSFLIFSCYEPERNCQDFKTGTFEYEALIGKEVLSTTFTRNDTLEIDYFNGKSDSSSIRWINDCEYIVKKINPKNMAEEKAIHMKILTTKGNEYNFEYNIVGDTNKQKGTANKID